MSDEDFEVLDLIERRFRFLKGDVDEFPASEPFDWSVAAGKTRSALTDALSARNVSFLFGAGASSYQEKKKPQLGIPIMAPLAKEFCGEISKMPSEFPTIAEVAAIKDAFKIDISGEPFKWNLERLMEVLYAFLNAFSPLDRADQPKVCEDIRSVITKVTNFVVKRCTEGKFSQPDADDTVLELYQAFYRRLIFRDRSLPRPWVFTTNYDLFNERAMDALGLPYANGFSGTVDRRFNPATFRYALAEQLDVSSRKWSAVDGFVYLCKLHGSVSWYDGAGGLFPIREHYREADADRVMIYPTPAKQSASFASPYSDLFREFQSRIVRDQSVLVTVGFAFGDQHINNIIYQALTVPTFRLIVFCNPTKDEFAKKLRALGDPRIWIIGGDAKEKDDQPAHYFKTIVNEFMPEEPGRRIDDAIAKVLAASVDPIMPTDATEDEASK